MFGDSKYVLLMAALLAAPFVARADEPEKAPQATSASVDPAFDCYAANSAWGLMFSGTAVDRNGDIWTYSERGKALPASSQIDGVRYFQKADLQAKFAQAKKTGSVDAKTLAEKSALAEKASSGKITHNDAGVRDAGSSSCHAYIYDAAKQRYRDIELGTDGRVSDMRTSNSAPEAQDLIVWLKSVGVAI